MVTPQPYELVVTVITYRRADKLRVLLEALRNFPASKIYIFCDGPRGQADKAECLRTQQMAQAYVNEHPHTILEVRDKNLGLNENIIQSITSVLNRHAFTLVLEEDVIPSPELAEFLLHYEPLLRDHKEVFSINAYHPCDQKLKGAAFATRRFFCWGWATWADRWHSVLPLLRGNVWPYEHYWQIPKDVGSDLAWAHRQHRMGRRKITWDRLLTLWTLSLGLVHFCPPDRLAKNIGLDGSGENCTSTDRALRLTEAGATGVEFLQTLPVELKPDLVMEEAIRRFFTNMPKGSWRKYIHYQLVAFIKGLQQHHL